MSDVYSRYVKYPRKEKPKRRTPKIREIKHGGLSPYELGQQAAQNGGSCPFDTNSSAGEAWQAGYDGE